MKYIILLRGVNLGGHKKIKMEELRQVLEIAGYAQISTYIQSGNICLECPEIAKEELSEAIGELLQKHFGFDVPTFARTLADWEKIIAELPFVEESIDFLHITLLHKIPDAAAVAAIDSSKFSSNERFVAIGQTVYLYCPDGYGRTKLTNNFWEKKLNCAATTRNWKTVLAMASL